MIVEAQIDKIIVEVNGIGYRINSSINSASQVKIGQVSTLFTHFVLREDEAHLYGFVDKEELAMFKKLISVSKIGPKVAAGILSTYTPQRLGAYIVSNDAQAIAKSPGVGKKTAERMILELKDKIDDSQVEYDQNFFNHENKNNNEVVDALMALGYTKHEGEQAASAVRDTSLSTEEMIRKALNWLAR